MAKKKTPPAATQAVTAERSGRLYCLLGLLRRGPQTRETLTRRLGLNIRGFYRDLELLRKVGITVELVRGRYELALGFDEALARLPFPDPGLMFSEAVQLAKGRTAAHRKLRQQIERMVR